MKFQLTVNSQHQDGFKLNVQASDEHELKIAQGLTEKLIEKISVIEVKVNNEEY